MQCGQKDKTSKTRQKHIKTQLQRGICFDFPEKTARKMHKNLQKRPILSQIDAKKRPFFEKKAALKNHYFVGKIGESCHSDGLLFL